MEMIDGITEQELRQHVANTRLHPDASARSSRIYRALRHITSAGSVFYVLTDTPEQLEDVFRILVDDEKVVGFELERQDPKALPTEIQQYSVEEYMNAIGGGFSGMKLRFALELARRDLGR
jgi:hypothetical protein